MPRSIALYEEGDRIFLIGFSRGAQLEFHYEGTYIRMRQSKGHGSKGRQRVTIRVGHR